MMKLGKRSPWRSIRIMVFFIFHFSFLLPNMIQAQELREGFYPDGKLRYKGYFVNNLPSGEITHYYPEGNIKAVMNHKGTETDAILYSKNGNIKTSGKYLDRKKSGIWEYRKENKIVTTEEYTEDKLNGIARKYLDDGTLLEIKNWKEGVLVGECKLFHNNGKLRIQVLFLNGKLNGPMKSFDYNGVMLVEGNYKNNLREGLWTYYTKEGKLNKKLKYHLGNSENKEAEELEESEQIDSLLNKGGKIADPADFMDTPDAYMKMMED